MSKNLVIVESPAKAKTIEGFLGKDFVVKSSYGHVRDLKKKQLSVDVENGFVPEYEISAEKKKVVAELQQLAKKAELIWLATDEDREGEAISWHLEEALKLKEANTRRIVFHEITKNAILKAIENPRKVDRNLVNAQQARRVLDRLVGFEISPILWKKVRPSLSAGRVQSVTVRLIVEREREIQDFTPVVSYRVVGQFQANGKKFRAELSQRYTNYEEALQFIKSCASAEFKVAAVETKPAKKSPAAPFTTSTLQQEAGRKLGFSVSRTMTVAQKLYEEGKITYMRTDSVNLSDFATKSAAEVITSTYGKEFSQTRRYTTKSKGAQEAHEAIRPVDMSVSEVQGDSGARRLYELIWKRTLASQMADARLEKTRVTISVTSAGNTLAETFIARGEVLKFEGFLKVYMESSDDEEEKELEDVLPALSEKDLVSMDHISGTQRFSNHPPRYSEASLVKKLEELGIGRPSTYAPTISTIQKRGYVVKEDREGEERKYKVILLNNGSVSEEEKTEITGSEKSKLFPTDIGIVVTDFLVEHFQKILNYNFTASVEKQFDEIAEGQKKWDQMIKDFYSGFHSTVQETLENSEKATGARELGPDPASGKMVYARIGRYGPMIQIGEVEDEEKPKFAGLRKDQSITSITLEEALDLFKLPRTVGSYEGKDIVAAVGRFGPYLRHNSKFYSIREKDGDDPLTIEVERAIEVIEAKRKEERERLIKTFEEDADLQILNGRWGPFLKAGKANYRLPKGTDPASLTYQDCVKIMQEADKGGKAPAAKKSAKSPAKSAAKTSTKGKKAGASKSKSASKTSRSKK